MAGVDLRPEGDLPRRTIEPSPNSGNRLSQDHAGPAVKISKWLPMPRIYKHGHHDLLGFQLHVLDTQHPV
jgi:hypothetical protein